MLYVAKAAACIQETFIIVFIADNLPNKYRGPIMAVNILFLNALTAFVNASEENKDFFFAEPKGEVPIEKY